MWEFMILALFEYEIGRESYFPSIIFLKTRTYLRIVRLCCYLDPLHPLKNEGGLLFLSVWYGRQ